MKRRDVFEGLLAAPLVASEVAADQISNTEPAVSKLPMVNMMERPKGGEGVKCRMFFGFASTNAGTTRSKD